MGNKETKRIELCLRDNSTNNPCILCKKVSSKAIFYRPRGGVFNIPSYLDGLAVKETGEFRNFGFCPECSFRLIKKSRLDFTVPFRKSFEKLVKREASYFLSLAL